ncbi:bifunctional adenosylcobinamide kinase/adenosylcobinamide-phosphate guanylyltransferase [Halorhodospira halochloris]|uniref:bifunctional adenosylcobinamide kinase/adenosylcobinamide-phosphate guanylyltransferase n=1 Tax=Halorhodospira halochloris TaxID=1052 RepID=UPI001EE85266|nr:bifunctional adenosylcobinamide kinase/adenosylcobinamide-phosphate guanylyltransferase [Halorhodospira halochloris]MCG5529818.1 bifunctional adenosylcobinamide kinase/adenosylcobinamide-phosphate guanylyltransferase [Halorhodospira halochloris]
MRELILGGVRSGKSRYAEQLATQSDQQVVYIATACAADDSEMARRIAAHRERRPPHWQTIEAPLELPEAITEHCSAGTTVLVDCLTLWLSNLLSGPDMANTDHAQIVDGTCCLPPTAIQRRIDALVQATEQSRGMLLLVSNETGFGVMPINALARRFCDEAGALHQALAKRCERVTLMVAGMPLKVKEPPGE